jgi:hypothetical protein
MWNLAVFSKYPQRMKATVVRGFVVALSLLYFGLVVGQAEPIPCASTDSCQQIGVLEVIEKLKTQVEDLRNELESLRRDLREEAFQRRAIEGVALSQCKVEINSEWRPHCDGAQMGTKMPTQASGFTPTSGIERAGNWSGWQFASSWNGGPYNCISLRLGPVLN